MKTEARKLVEVLYLDNYSKIHDALTEFLKSKDEDALIIILHEAINGNYLRLCSKTAAIISGFISEYDVTRSLLSVIGHGINDPANLAAGCEWLDIILAEKVEMDLEEWSKSWNRLDYVIEVRKMFEEARYSTAISERCNPVSSDYMPKHFRPDPIPSDLIEQGWRHGPNGELLAPGEPDPPVVPEIVDDE